MYKVIDSYEGFEKLIGKYDTFDAARAAARERFEETDGECTVSIYALTKKGYRVIV